MTKFYKFRKNYVIGTIYHLKSKDKEQIMK